MIADSYDLKEVEDAFFFEVEGSVSALSICVEHPAGLLTCQHRTITDACCSG